MKNSKDQVLERMGYINVEEHFQDKFILDGVMNYYGMVYFKSVGKIKIFVASYRRDRKFYGEIIFVNSSNMEGDLYKVFLREYDYFTEETEFNSFTELIVGLIKLEEEIKETNKNIKT